MYNNICFGSDTGVKIKFRSRISINTNNCSNPVYSYNEIDFSKTIIPEFTCDDKSQKNEFTCEEKEIYYDDPNIKCKSKSKIFVETGVIELISHNIFHSNANTKMPYNKYCPKTNAEKMLIEKIHAYLNIGLDPSQTACAELRKFIKLADKWADSENTRRKLFGNLYNKYQFMPTIKKHKLEFKREYELQFVKFRFYIVSCGEKEFVNKTIINKIVKNKIIENAVSTIVDVRNEIGFRSKINLIFCCDFILSSGNKLTYGLGFTVYVINYQPKTPIPTLSFFSSDSDSDLDSDLDSDSNSFINPDSLEFQKSYFETQIKKFNEGFKSFGFDNQLHIYLCPFGGKCDLIPVPDWLRKKNVIAAEFVDKYNHFGALNNNTLNKYSLVIISRLPVTNQRMKKIFDATKVLTSDLEHKVVFILRTTEQNLIETMQFILNEEDLQCPKYYSLEENNKCVFYFEKSDNIGLWEIYLRGFYYIK